MVRKRQELEMRKRRLRRRAGDTASSTVRQFPFESEIIVVPRNASYDLHDRETALRI